MHVRHRLGVGPAPERPGKQAGEHSDVPPEAVKLAAQPGNRLAHDMADQCLGEPHDVVTGRLRHLDVDLVELGEVPAGQRGLSGSRRTFGAMQKILSNAVSDACLYRIALVISLYRWP